MKTAMITISDKIGADVWQDDECVSSVVADIPAEWREKDGFNRSVQEALSKKNTDFSNFVEQSLDRGYNNELIIHGVIENG